VNIFVDHHSDRISKSVAPRQEKPLIAPTVSVENKCDFDSRRFLATIGDGRKVVAFPTKQTIFWCAGWILD
jgi:hypothetical protein